MALDPFGSSVGLDPSEPVAGLDPFAPDPNAPGPFKRGLGAGAKGVKSALYGAGALAARAVGVTGLEQAALARSQAAGEAAAADTIPVESIDWSSPGSIANYFKFALGSAVPSIALIAAGGGVGRGLGAVAGRAAPAAASVAPRVGMYAGAAVPDVALEAGSIYPEAVREGTSNAAVRALGGGAAAASLDFLPVLAAEHYLTKLPAGFLAKRGFGAAAGRAAIGSQVGGAFEGAQELAQSVIERTAAGSPLTGPEATSDYLASFLGGYAPGATIGALLGPFPGRLAAKPRPGPAPQPAPAAPAVAPEQPLPEIQEPETQLPDVPGINAPIDFDLPTTGVEVPAVGADPYNRLEAPIAQDADEARREDILRRVTDLTAALVGLDAEAKKPAKDRRPDAEIGAARAQAQGALSTMAQELAAVEHTIKVRQVLAETPKGPLAPRTSSARAVDLAPTEADTTAAETAVAKMKRGLGLLVSSREAKLAPVAAAPKGGVEPVTSSVKERVSAVDEKTRRGAVEEALVQAVAPNIAALVQAKNLPAGGRAKLTSALTNALNKIAVQAAAKPSNEEAQAHIAREVPKALKGRVVAVDAEEIARTMSRAVDQAHTLYSKGATSLTQKQALAEAQKRWQGGAFGGQRGAIRDLGAGATSTPEARARAVARIQDIDNGKVTFEKPSQRAKARDEALFASLRHRYVVGSEENGFFTIRGRGDTWAEALADADKREGRSQESNAALTQDDFDALPPRAQGAVMDEYNKLQAERGQALVAELKRLIGVDPDLEVETFAAEPGGHVGSYTRVGPLKSLITLATNAVDSLSVAAHEGYHYAEDRLLTSAERQIVANALKPGRPMHRAVLERAQAYDRQYKTHLADEIASSPHEARAYAFQFWRNGGLKAEGALQRVFLKIRETLEKISNFVYGRGFQSAEDVFAALDRGEFAERVRGITSSPIDTAPKQELMLRAREMFGDQPGLLRMAEWITNRRGEPVNGIHTTRGEIGVSLAGPHPMMTLNHEAFHHAMRYHFTTYERSVLLGAFRRGSDMAQRVEAALIRDGEGWRVETRQRTLYDKDDIGNEEIVAHAFQYWKNGDVKFNASVTSAFEGLADFFTRIASWITGGEGNRFPKRITAEELFIKLDTGGFAEGALSAEFHSAAAANVTLSVLEREAAKIADPKNRQLVQRFLQTLAADVGRGNLKGATEYVAMVLRDNQQSKRTPGLPDFTQPDTRPLWDLINRFTSEVKAQVLFSSAAVEVDRRMQAGELEQAQRFNLGARYFDEANLNQPSLVQALGALGEGGKVLTRNFASWFTTNNYLATFSSGHKNVIRILRAFGQRKQTLIAQGSLEALSAWHDNVTSQADLDAVGKVILDRTVGRWTTDSAEYQNAIRPLTERQRRMLDQSNGMFADFLMRQFHAEEVDRVTLLPGDEFQTWRDNRLAQVQDLIKYGYAPERRYGSHVVRMYATVMRDGKEQKLTYARSHFQGRAAAAAMAAQIEAQLTRDGVTEVKVEVSDHYKADREQALSMQQFLDTARRYGIGITQAERERLARALVHADSMRNTRIFRREDVPGYSTDIMRVVHEFVVATANQIAYSEYTRSINDALDGKPVDATVFSLLMTKEAQLAALAPTDPARAQVEQELRALRDEYAALQEASKTRNLWDEDGPTAGFYRGLADEAADFVMTPDRGGAWSRNWRAFTMLDFIGGSLSSGVVNLMSIPMLVPPWLSQHTSYLDATAKTYSSLQMASRHFNTLHDLAKLKDPNVRLEGIDDIPGLRQALLSAGENGETLDTEMHQILGLAQGQIFASSRTVQRAMNVWMAPFRLTEQLNRLTSFIAGYRVAQEKGLTGRAAYEMAVETVRNTQNTYSAENRPKIARNSVGALLFMFRSFPLFMIETLHLLYRQNPKAAIYMLMGLTLAAGVQGLPFVELIEDLIDTFAQRVLGSPFNSRRALRNIIKDASEALVGADLSELALRGAVNSLTGLSISSRVGMGNFIPGSRLGTADSDYGRVAQDILGAPFKGAQQVGQGLLKVSKGEFQAALRGGVLGNAVANMAKGWEESQHGYAADARGRKIADVGGVEAFFHMFGFTSAQTNKLYELDKIDRQQVAFYSEVQSDLTNHFVRAFRDGDAARAQELMAFAQSWNERYPEMPILLSPASIRREVVLSGLPLNQRTLMTMPRLLRGSSVASETVE